MSKPRLLELRIVEETGFQLEDIQLLNKSSRTIVQANVDDYRRIGYQQPRVGYLSVQNGDSVGSFGFKEEWHSIGHIIEFNFCAVLWMF
ncbi:MAG: hypothetical protein MK081_05385 [Flavobacteriales bacterium]|nr:hypothetical protein [Flavobacteriales bacterium]